MKRLQGLLSIKDIYHLIEDEDYDIIEMVKMSLQVPQIYVYTNYDYSAIVVYMPIDNMKYNTHVYTSKEGRGKKLKDLMIKSGLKIFKETSCTTIMSFIDDGNDRLKLFLSAVGAERIGKIKDSSRWGDTILYCFYKKDWV